VPVTSPRWNTAGNASISPRSPVPGRWVVPAHGPRTPYWVQPGGGRGGPGYKYKAACAPCPAICEVCP
jgi:hypothetical protein